MKNALISCGDSGLYIENKNMYYSRTSNRYF